MKTFHKFGDELGICSNTIVLYAKKGLIKKPEHYTERMDLHMTHRYITPAGEREMKRLLKKRKHKNFYLNPKEDCRGRLNGGWRFV